MTAQLLEYARIELTRALMDNSGKTKGQLQAFCEHPPAEKDRCPRKHIHMVEFEDGRRVKAQNTSLYLLETRSRRRPSPPINDYEFAGASYKEYAGAALARLMSVNRSAWLRVYAPHWAHFKRAFDELDISALQHTLYHHCETLPEESEWTLLQNATK